MVYRTTPQRPKFTHVCHVNDELCYAIERASALRRTNTRFWESVDGGASWRELPLRLTLTSEIRRFFLFADEWPPSSPRIDDLVWEHGRLRMRYRDDLGSHTHSAYVWDAFYLPEKRRWELRKIGRRHWDREDEWFGERAD